MDLRKTPLDALHRELGARMVPFAGYDMPVQYRSGIIAEHLQTRGQASLFDVSHMGQLVLEGEGVAATLEALVPADVEGLAQQRQCYTLLMNDSGGVRDDLIITRWGADRFLLVVNAACKAGDREYIASRLSPGQVLAELEDQALLAIQGPQAREALRALIPEIAELTFLDGVHLRYEGSDMFVSCSGYTGEDGFEISLPGERAEALARRLLEHPAVAPAGLGARDSLRLEAGLCLYGHELSAEISPVEAGLTWSIGRARRPDGARAGGYPGAARVTEEMANGAARRRVGLAVTGRRPVREGQVVLDATGAEVGVVTSGGFGASVDAPIAMAYVTPGAAEPGTALAVDARGKQVGVTVAKLPFVAPRYYRG
jgi:aminomethyltransferase